LKNLISRYGLSKFIHTCNYLLDKSEYLTRKDIASISKTSCYGKDYIEYRDRNLKICVNVQFTGTNVNIDFTGSSEQIVLH